MKNTTMINQTKLYITKPTSKKSEDYEKKYCHPKMHDKNYAISNIIMVDRLLVRRLKDGDVAAREELRLMLVEIGFEGTAIVQYHAGGLGKRGKAESMEHWRAKKRAGWQEIARMEV